MYQNHSRGGQRRQYPRAEQDPEAEQFRKIFIGGLSYETTEEGLKEHFGKWGEITDCVVMKDPNTKRSRGFGFITYKYASEVDLSQENRPHKINTRDVETKRAMPREFNEPQESTKKMFIGGLKDDTSEDQVKEAFCTYGDIERVDLIRDKESNKVKGFGFVEFQDTDSVDKCVLKKFFTLNGKEVEVKKAVAKENQRGGDSGRGGRGGGRGGRGGGGRGFNDWNQGGYNQGGYNQGGYNQGNYGNSYGNQGGGGGGYGNGYGNQGGGGGGWNQNSGAGGGGYDNYSGGYGGNNYGGNFGQNYGDNYGGGAMKNSYSNRGQGPYGSGGYNNSGGYNRR
ncbi:heterogeneous nuclear ribonucleoprotein A3 homolog 2-like isoform X2 [Mizuhopecten yessoensis]|uniref:heterogeneous nuclear ribonucleoprotein A3 homolog 2-like isoform X2 n=1 Tax=Mizuhopecten yessoensis TaxID=6573 RepID=UPI000B45ED87|nr:heterogeneous nuclear ribonucleoprotein A3 homolog 2-like isoform X2 [Mizuhopecten yessoensis]